MNWLALIAILISLTSLWLAYRKDSREEQEKLDEKMKELQKDICLLKTQLSDIKTDNAVLTERVSNEIHLLSKLDEKVDELLAKD